MFTLSGSLMAQPVVSLTNNKQLINFAQFPKSFPSLEGFLSCRDFLQVSVSPIVMVT